MRFLLNKGLSRKLLLILVIGTTLTMACTSIFSYYLANKLSKNNAGVAMQQGAESLGEQIEISLDAAVKLLEQLGENPHVRQSLAAENAKDENLTAEQIKARIQKEVAIEKAPGSKKMRPGSGLDAALAAFRSANPAFETLIAGGRHGRTVGASGKLYTPYPQEEGAWAEASIAGLGKAAISEPFFPGKGRPLSILMCIPVSPERNGKFEGEIYAEFSLKRLVSGKSFAGQNILGFILEGEGGKKRALHILSPSTLASRPPAEFSFPGGEMSRENSGRFEVKLEQLGLKALAGFAPVHGPDSSISAQYVGRPWFVLLATPGGAVMGPVNALFRQSLIFALILIVLISLAGLMMSQQVLKPIHMLQLGVQEIGQGNLDHRIDIGSSDEIEALAFEFNRMADRMQRTQEQLQRRGKELEQRVNQLRRLQAQLMQSERMAATGELAAQIAHEINNPLGIIKNYVSIARMLMPEEDSNRENLKIVDQEINRIAGIVRRLLKFAKPGGEDLQNVQINQVLEELLALLRGQLFRRKIEVEMELSDKMPEVNISTDQMRQVFLNLIKNAEDAMSEGGKLMVKTRYRKGRVEVEISDTGCGIPAEDVKNIFEPFFTTKGVKGTGLGLSVSYGIVKNYSGEINVESVPGAGTSFTIQLPVVSDKVFQVIQSP
jgi:signal transduction histidine kinase